MGICWYCHHGWSKPVKDIFDEAVAALDGYDGALMFGPSHIVWSDENFDEENIKWCIGECQKTEQYADRYDEADLMVVQKSLYKLLELDRSVREPEPDDYDDEHPERYPPAAGVVMVPRG